MIPDPSRRFIAPTAAGLVLVLLAGLLTVSFQLGARSGGLGGLPAQFDPLGEIYAHVQLDAVEVPDDEQLAQGAIQGMLGALGDPYAAYYGQEAFGRLNELLDGTFTGVGLLLEERPGGLLEVVRVLPDGPAAKAGVMAGERIVSVNGESVADKPSEEVVAAIRGPEGTSVTVGFEGPAGGRELELVRAKLDLPVIESELLDGGVGLVRLIEFSDTVAERLRTEVETLVEQGATGLVLDLRGNPGGLLHASVDVASVFIGDGPIVSVKERERDVDVYEAQGEAAFPTLPLVVLVDKGSASASEIVAGAVQDRDRGLIVGQTTFGKGTVQVVRPLSGGGGVKFTTAEYFTPSGTSIEGTGVVPDLPVEGTPEEQLEAARQALLELAGEAAA